MAICIWYASHPGNIPVHTHGRDAVAVVGVGRGSWAWVICMFSAFVQLRLPSLKSLSNIGMRGAWKIFQTFIRTYITHPHVSVTGPWRPEARALKLMKPGARPSTGSRLADDLSETDWLPERVRVDTPSPHSAQFRTVRTRRACMAAAEP